MTLDELGKGIVGFLAVVAVAMLGYQVDAQRGAFVGLFVGYLLVSRVVR